MSEDKAECDREHQVIAEKNEAVQNELRLSADRHAQGKDIQAAQMNAMGHRVEEMKDLLMQRELRMDSRMQEMCFQIQTMEIISKNKQPQTENLVTKDSVQGTDMLPPNPPTENMTLKSGERSTNLTSLSTSKPTPSEHQQSSSINIRRISTMTKANQATTCSCKKGSANDPLSIETCSMGITDSRAPLCIDATIQMTITFQSVNPTLGELTEEVHTSNEELPPGNPCANITGRKEVPTVDASVESVKSTRGSSLLPPAANECTIIPGTNRIY